MGSLLSVHDIAMENDYGDDWRGYRNSNRYSSSSPRQRRRRRRPALSQLDYSDIIKLELKDSVYLSGSNRKVNPMSNSSPSASQITFMTYKRDPDSNTYTLKEAKMPRWTQFTFIEFKDIGNDSNGPRYPARLRRTSDPKDEYLVPWSNFTQNFTPFDKESSQKPEDSPNTQDEDWMGYLFEDSVWKSNESHIQSSSTPTRSNRDQRGW